MGEADNKLTKMIRPLLMIWTMVLFTVILFWDAMSGAFDVKSGYLDIIELVLIAEIGFYFTSRGWEKVSSMKYKKEEKIEKKRLERPKLD